MHRPIATVGILLLLAGSCAAAGPAWADGYEDGRAAYLRYEYVTGLKFWQPLAEQGDPGSENGMGLLSMFGKGVPQDVDAAIRWFRRAADQGFAKAEYNLGRIHASDQWGRADSVEALRMYLAAANHGYAP